jgi:putative hemolysin
MLYLEIGVILLLILFNGIFAMSELAIVSSKKVHLRRLAEEGNKAAAQALAFAEDSGQFLPIVQVGMTSISVLAGAVGSAALSEHLAVRLKDWGISSDRAELIAIAVMVVLVTYLTLIIGELVPKELALRKPEKFAMFIAPIIHSVAKITWPVVWLLNRSSSFVLWLIRAGEKPESTVTQEEVQAMIVEGADYGVFAERESEMLTGVMLLADKPIRAFMIPRVDVVSFDCNATEDEVKAALQEHGYSRFPVRPHDDEHHILGIAETKDILTALLSDGPFQLKTLIKETVVFPDNTSSLKVMEYLRHAPTHVAIIIDEHGAFEGIVTLVDLFSAITGELYGQDGGVEMRQRPDGSWMIDGSTLIDRVFNEIGLRGKPESASYHTMAGFVLNHSHAVPKEGYAFEHKGYRFEVLDMDGYRIDKVLVQKTAPRPS